MVGGYVQKMIFICWMLDVRISIQSTSDTSVMDQISCSVVKADIAKLKAVIATLEAADEAAAEASDEEVKAQAKAAAEALAEVKADIAKLKAVIATLEAADEAADEEADGLYI
jgi:hypothetical protein